MRAFNHFGDVSGRITFDNTTLAVVKVKQGRERRAKERRIKAAHFPTIKTLEGFDFKAQPSINKVLVTELMRCVPL